MSNKNAEDSPPYVEKTTRASSKDVSVPKPRGGDRNLSERRSISTSSKPRFDNQHSGVEQLDMETGAVVRRYFSLKKACHCMNVTMEYVEECCLGDRDSAYGFKWRFTSKPVEEEGPAEGETFLPLEELLARRIAFGDYKRSKKVNRQHDVEYEVDDIVDDRDNAEYEAMLLSEEGQGDQQVSETKAALLAPELSTANGTQIAAMPQPQSLPSLLFDQSAAVAAASSVPPIPLPEPSLMYPLAPSPLAM